MKEKRKEKVVCRAPVDIFPRRRLSIEMHHNCWEYKLLQLLPTTLWEWEQRWGSTMRAESLQGLSWFCSESKTHKLSWSDPGEEAGTCLYNTHALQHTSTYMQLSLSSLHFFPLIYIHFLLFMYELELLSLACLAINPWNDLGCTSRIHCSRSSSSIKLPDTRNHLHSVTISTQQRWSCGNRSEVTITLTESEAVYISRLITCRREDEGLE